MLTHSTDRLMLSVHTTNDTSKMECNLCQLVNVVVFSFLTAGRLFHSTSNHYLSGSNNAQHWLIKVQAYIQGCIEVVENLQGTLGPLDIPTPHKRLQSKSSRLCQNDVISYLLLRALKHTSLNGLGSQTPLQSMRCGCLPNANIFVAPS